MFRRSNATSFTRFKRPAFKARSSSRTRVATRSPFRRAVSNRRQATPGLSTMHAPTIPMYVIPKNADRAHVINEYSCHAMLTWASTAERFIGTAFQPYQLGVSNTTVGPYSDIWPPSGGGTANVACQRSVASTPGFLTATSRFKNYIVTKIDVDVIITRQSASDASLVMVGMMPLNAVQYSQLITRNTTASPLVNKNYWLPGLGITDTGVSVNLPGQEYQAVKEQPYVQIRALKNPGSGKPQVKLSQSYSPKKFVSLGYPYDKDNYGILPQTTGSDATSPVMRSYHYFFMFSDNGAASPGNEDFDIDFKIKVHCTYFNPTFNAFAPTYSITNDDSKEEKKEEKDEDDFDLGRGGEMDFTNLSLVTPKAPYTCLNPKHPPGHVPSSTCV